jgi:hypothetical protein
VLRRLIGRRQRDVEREIWEAPRRQPVPADVLEQANDLRFRKRWGQGCDGRLMPLQERAQSCQCFSACLIRAVLRRAVEIGQERRQGNVGHAAEMLDLIDGNVEGFQFRPHLEVTDENMKPLRGLRLAVHAAESASMDIIIIESEDARQPKGDVVVTAPCKTDDRPMRIKPLLHILVFDPS